MCACFAARAERLSQVSEGQRNMEQQLRAALEREEAAGAGLQADVHHLGRRLTDCHHALDAARVSRITSTVDAVLRLTLWRTPFPPPPILTFSSPPLIPTNFPLRLAKLETSFSSLSHSSGPSLPSPFPSPALLMQAKVFLAAAALLLQAAKRETCPFPFVSCIGFHPTSCCTILHGWTPCVSRSIPTIFPA